METTDLQELNDKQAALSVGALVLVIVLMATGFIGNLHVLLVFALKMKSTNYRIFILFLSVLDLSACSIAMPLTVYTLIDPLMFATRTICKIHAFSSYFLCIASAFTLLVIAIERYRRICKPFGWQIRRRIAKCLCCCVLVIALFSSSPTLILLDSVTRNSTKYPWISAEICGTIKKHEKYFCYLHIFLFVIFLPLLIALIVLYSNIWKTTKDSQKLQESHILSNDRNNSTAFTQSTDDVSSAFTSNEVYISDTNKKSASLKHDVTNTTAAQIPQSHPIKGPGRPGHSIRARKTSLAFFLITVIFFISYIPHIVMEIVFGAVNDIYLRTDSEVIYLKIVFYLVYVSNMANCFVYGCLDARFRHEIKYIYQPLLCCK